MMLTETKRDHHPPATDVNFNSPGHRSSVDGSFIQDDETEMHLILDFESESARIGKGGILTTSQLYQPTSVLTSSWVNRQQTQWATDFDANIAELDFDNVDTSDILHLQQPPPRFTNNHYDSTWPRNMKLQRVGDWNLAQDNYHRSVGHQPLQGSLDLSISHSDSLLSSSDPIDAFGGIAADVGESMVQATSIISPAQDMSVSLDLSKVLAEEEQLIAACMTRPRDYVLTWEAASKIVDSMTASVFACKESNQSVDFYKDAKLSDATEDLGPSCHVPNERQLPVQTNKTLCTSEHVMTTWGAIKQATEAEDKRTPKSHSLPDLNPHPFHQMLMQCSGAGEHMLSMEAKVPLYDLMTSSTSQGWPSPPPSRLSLMQVFQTKLNEQGVVLPTDPVQSPTQDPNLNMHQEGTTNNQEPDYQPDTVHREDHDYAEYYVGGRYIDVNHNEIGYSPPSTQGIQTVNKATTWQGQARLQRRNSVMSESVSDTDNTTTVNDRWSLIQPSAPIKPPRTFATLLKNNENEREESSKKQSSTQLPVYMVEQSVQTQEKNSGQFVPAVVWTTSSTETQTTSVCSSKVLKELTSNPLPPLNFLQFPFEVPSLFPNAPPFPVDFLESSFPSTECGDPSSKASPWQVPNYPALIGQQNEKANLQSKSHKPILGVPQSIPNFSQKYGADPLSTVGLGMALNEESHKNLLAPPFNMSKTGGQLAGIVADMTLPSGLTNNSISPSPTASCSSKMASIRDRDSGLGSSGPSHIRDWESLAVLLPKNVVQACSFFNNEKSSPRNGGSIDKPAASHSQHKQHRPRRLGRHQNDVHQHCSRRRRPCSEPLFDRHVSGVGRFESIREEDADGCSPRDACCCSRNQSAYCKPYYPIWCHSLPPYCVYNSCHPVAPPPPVHCHHCSPCPHGQSHCCRGTLSDFDDCNPNKLTRHRSNLQRWRAPCTPSDSDSESGSDTPHVTHSHTPLIQHRVPLHSISSDSEEANDYSLSRGDMMIRSECIGSSHSSPPRRVLSMQNMNEDPRMVSSFLRPHQRSMSNMAHSETSKKCMSSACATCYRVRSPSVERVPEWANPQIQDPVWRQWFCDCRTSDVLEELEQDERRRRRTRCLVTFLDGLRASTMSEEESSLLSTPIYHQKKELVQNVIRVCENVTAAFSANADNNKYPSDLGDIRKLVKGELCPAIKQLLCDGLKESSTVWMVVTDSATPGPATKSIHELVCDLSGDNNDNEHQWIAFINGLLSMRSVDCWLSYLALKDRLINAHYSDAAFILRATSAYRSLFTRLLIGVQSLGLHDFEKLHLLSTPPSTPKRYSLLPTRLPSDSRVPKSSSIPSRLSPPRASKSRSVDSGLARLRTSGGVGGASPTRIPIPVSKSSANGWRHQYIEDGEVVLCLY